jgi:hypothetical protein
MNAAKKELNLVLNNVLRLSTAELLALMSWIRLGLEHVVADAGMLLVVTTSKGGRDRGPVKLEPGSLRIELDFDYTPPLSTDGCGLALGECGSGGIWVAAHRALAVCGSDPASRNVPVLSDPELLGHALANTVLHEVGHHIGNFTDNRNAGNIMSTGGPPNTDRTLASVRAYFGGTLSWTGDQKGVLVRNLKAGKAEGGFR